jgi:hypothetical protein
MQPVNLIVSCTNRKKAVVPEELRLRSLINKPISQRLEQWLGRLTTYNAPTRRAHDLYAGDHWYVAKSIPEEAAENNLDVRLWVCSAGYGLVSPSGRLKPYSATFASRHPDSVSASALSSNNGTAMHEWWSGLACHSFFSNGVPRSITEMAAREPNVPLVIVASEPYLVAMESDLLGAIETLSSKDLLSILSTGSTSKGLSRLNAYLLPADARFEAMVGGTRAALNARVARLLFQKVSNGVTPSRDVFTSMLVQFASDLPPLRRFCRRRLSDAEVRRFISDARRDDPTVSKSRLLRRLRDSGAACDQGRFSEVFGQAVRSTSDGT